MTRSCDGVIEGSTIEATGTLGHSNEVQGLSERLATRHEE